MNDPITGRTGIAKAIVHLALIATASTALLVGIIALVDKIRSLFP